jgi:hypothetical protein
MHPLFVCLSRQSAQASGKPIRFIFHRDRNGAPTGEGRIVADWPQNIRRGSQTHRGGILKRDIAAGNPRAANQRCVAKFRTPSPKHEEILRRISFHEHAVLEVAVPKGRSARKETRVSLRRGNLSLGVPFNKQPRSGSPFEWRLGAWMLLDIRGPP